MSIGPGLRSCRVRDWSRDRVREWSRDRVRDWSRDRVLDWSRDRVREWSSGWNGIDLTLHLMRCMCMHLYRCIYDDHNMNFILF